MSKLTEYDKELIERAKNEINLYYEKQGICTELGELPAKMALICYEKVISKLLDGNQTNEFYNIFNKLLANYPLTPIEDIPEIWDKTAITDDLFQCKRYPTLFKRHKESDGTACDIFVDMDRFVCIDLEENEDMILEQYKDDFIEGVVNEIYPISFPYQPTRPIKIFTEKFRYYENREKWDTLAITYIRLPNGKMKRINKYFKHEIKKDTSSIAYGDIIQDEMIEIDQTEYFARKQKYLYRKEKENG